MIGRTYLHFGAPTRWPRLDTERARIVLALLAALLLTCFAALCAAAWLSMR